VNDAGALYRVIITVGINIAISASAILRQCAVQIRILVTYLLFRILTLQYFDTVGWVTGRASCLLRL